MRAAVADPVLFYAELYEAFAAGLERTGAAGLELRRQALDHLRAAGFDVAGREEWKYGDLAPVPAGGFAPALEAAPRRDLPAGLPASGQALRLVFVDGRHWPDLSTPAREWPAGVAAQPLPAGASTPELGSVARLQDAPLTALATAFRGDGLLLRLEAGVALDRPLEAVFLLREGSSGALVAPRILVVAGPGSRATLHERHLGGDGAALTLPLTEVICEPGSDFRHLKWLGEGRDILHYGSTHVRQAADSRYDSREFLLGGSRIRRETHLHLGGPGAACDLAGLALMDGDRQADVRTRVHHDAPSCRTRELYKGVFLQDSRGVFDGLIKVARGAQGTEAFQSNRNLLLGERAVSHSIPRLEIYADDVKCSHGSATGQLSAEQLYYLRSRGFSAAEARDLLALAFAREIVDTITEPQIRQELAAEVQRRLAEQVP